MNEGIISFMKNLCYTIGYKQKSLSEFIDILRKNKINCVIDVQSRSGCEEYDKEYTKENLKSHLNQIGIYYIFMGEEFTVDKEELDYNQLENSNIQSGIDRIMNGIKKEYDIAIMSKETDAFACKRGILISRLLQKRGIEIQHIINEEEIKSQRELEEEMVKSYGAKLVKKIAELSIKGIMSNKDLELDEEDFKIEMINEAYNIRVNELKQTF